MFVRIKKIKGYQYAYLVENTWEKGTSKQKVKEYLGRVYSFPSEALSFPEMDSGTEFGTEVVQLLKWQLSRFGFNIVSDAAIKDGLKVDLHSFEFIQEKSKKPFVLKGKEGYLCKHTIKQLLAFTSEGFDEKVGKDLAHAFVQAGIDIPQDVFVKVFEKVYVHPEEKDI